MLSEHIHSPPESQVPVHGWETSCLNVYITLLRRTASLLSFSAVDLCVYELARHLVVAPLLAEVVQQPIIRSLGDFLANCVQVLLVPTHNPITSATRKAGGKRQAYEQILARLGRFASGLFQVRVLCVTHPVCL